MVNTGFDYKRRILAYADRISVRPGDAVAALCGASKTCGVDYLPQNAEAEARGLTATHAGPYGEPEPTAPPPIYPEISNN